MEYMKLSPEEAKAKRAERQRLFRDAIHKDKSPERIPIFGQVWTWKYLNAGYTIREGIYDYDKAYDSFCKQHNDFNMDLYVDMGVRNPIKVIECFGPTDYIIDDEHMNLKDSALMGEDDYANFIKDGPIKFCFERAIPAKFKITDPEVMIKKYGDAAKEYQLFTANAQRILNTYRNDYGVPSLGYGKYVIPLDWMVWGMRGMAGLGIDMRRHKEELHEALEMLDKFLEKSNYSSFDTYDPSDDRFAMFSRVTALCQTIMSNKQFGEFCWPYYKRYLDTIVKNNCTLWMYLEGSIANFIDYLQDIPDGYVGMLMDMDDPFWLKKELPNLALCGSYPVDMLQNGTPQECIDKAKSLIDVMAADGKYIFGTNKMMSYAQDGKSENFKAVLDFVREYKGGK